MNTAIKAPTIPCPECARCGKPTRLIAAEPHPRVSQADLRTFRCASCDDTQTLVVPYGMTGAVAR